MSAGDPGCYRVDGRRAFTDPDQPADGPLRAAGRKRGWPWGGAACPASPTWCLLDEPTNTNLDLPGNPSGWKPLAGRLLCLRRVKHDRALPPGSGPTRLSPPESIGLTRWGYFRAAGRLYDGLRTAAREFLGGPSSAGRESGANQVRRRGPSGGGRKEFRRGASRRQRIGGGEGTRPGRRAELAELRYRNAAGGAAGIDFSRQPAGQTLTRCSGPPAWGDPPSPSRAGRVSPALDHGNGQRHQARTARSNGSGQEARCCGCSPAKSAPGTRFRSVRPNGHAGGAVAQGGRARLDPAVPLRKALCDSGDTVL